MMTRTILALAAATATTLAAAPANAQAAAPADKTDSAPAPAKPKKARRICGDLASTGSRMGNSVCKTAEEWAAIDKAQQVRV
jgi:hypothetical protein